MYKVCVIAKYSDAEYQPIYHSGLLIDVTNMDNSIAKLKLTKEEIFYISIVFKFYICKL